MSFKIFLKALKETIFNIAVLHLVMLAAYVAMSRDFSFFSMVSILDMKLFFPEIDYGSLNLALIGMVLVLAMWCFHYFRLAGNMSKHD
jgi:hypothetical protein